MRRIARAVILLSITFLAFGCGDDTSPDGGKTVGQITLPAVTILRDPQTERIVGGTPLLKNLGQVANGSLDQIEGDLPLDGTALTRSFRFDVPEGFPQDLSYKLTGKNRENRGENRGHPSFSRDNQWVAPFFGNSVALNRFREEVRRVLARRERGNRPSWNWFARLEARYDLPIATAIHSVYRKRSERVT